jgi:hypothetical protein
MASSPMNGLAALACLAVGCGLRPGPDAITAAIPPGTVALACIDLDRVHSAPVFPRLPQTVRALADTYRTAQRILIAWNGTDVLLIVRGTASGATAIGPNLVATGSPESIRAATAQYRTGKPGVPGLVDYGGATAGQSPLWAVVRGGLNLPLSGNSRNLNRLLRNLDYAALAVGLTTSIDLRITALGRDEQAARDFEESLRGILSLMSAAEARRPQIAALLASVAVRRNAKTATASLRVPPEMLDTLAGAFR